MGKVTVEYQITRVDVREAVVIIYMKGLPTTQVELPNMEGTVVIGPDPKVDKGQAMMDMANKMFNKIFSSGENPFPMQRFIPIDEMNLQVTRDQYESLGKPLPGEALKAEISIAIQEGERSSGLP